MNDEEKINIQAILSDLAAQIAEVSPMLQDTWIKEIFDDIRNI